VKQFKEVVPKTRIEKEGTLKLARSFLPEAARNLGQIKLNGKAHLGVYLTCNHMQNQSGISWFVLKDHDNLDGSFLTSRVYRNLQNTGCFTIREAEACSLCRNGTRTMYSVTSILSSMIADQRKLRDRNQTCKKY